MGHDPFSPISPARVNALLLPAGRIRSATFNNYVALLQSESIVQLEDVVPVTRGDDEQFAPASFPPGKVLFDFSPSQNGRNNLEAFPFELNRSFQVVLAIADGAELPSKDESDVVDESSPPFKALLADFGRNQVRDNRLLVYELLVFNKKVHRDIGNNIVFLPNADAKNSTSVRHAVHSLAALLVTRMADLASKLQSGSIESPRLLSLSRSESDGRQRRIALAPTSRSERAGSTASRSETPVSEEGDSRASSKNRFSAVGQNSSASTDVQLNRSKARYQIVLGGLYLQAGQWQGALRELSEGASAARSNTVDYLWHAKALEILLVCMMMFAWAGLEFSIPQVCNPPTDKTKLSQLTPISMTGDLNENASLSNERRTESLQNLTQVIPGMVRTILTLYARASSFTQEMLPQMMMCETKIRLANLLVMVHLGRGSLDVKLLDSLVLGMPMNSPTSMQETARIARLRRNEIATMLVEAATDSQTEISNNEFINVLVGITSAFSMLGLERKQAFYLKELLQRLIPSLVEARKIGAAEMGIHPAAGLSISGGNAHESIASLHRGVRTLLDLAAKVYGMPTVGASDDSIGERTSIKHIERRASEWSHSQNFGDIMLKMEILRVCINVCEALPDLPGGLHFTVELLQTARRTAMMSQHLANATPLIPHEEQMRLIYSIKRTVGAAAKLGIPDMRANYWDDFLVRGIQLLDVKSANKLISHTPRDLILAVGEKGDLKKDPFIYNPFSKSKPVSGTTPVLVVGEVASFGVTLQNPFEFDIEIDHISLLTEGCEFEASTYSTMLGPFCSQNFVFSGTPRSSGVLKTIGCRVRIRDCYQQSFYVFSREWQTPTMVKLKRAGENPVDSLPHLATAESGPTGKRIHENTQNPNVEELSIVVIQPQPIISVKSSSLTQPSIMLLEGETKSFQVTVQNESNTTPVDLLLFSFEDSVSKQLQIALENRELGPVELHELQIQLSANPCIRRVAEDEEAEEPSLPPNNSRTFMFEVYGKPGLMNAVVLIDYAYLSIPYSEVREKFYTRQARFAVTVTVNGGVDIPRLNILPFSDNLMWREDQEKQAHGRPSVDEDGSQSSEKSQVSVAERQNKTLSSIISRPGLHRADFGFCLVLLDLRNVWPRPLNVEIKTHAEDAVQQGIDKGDGSTISETLQPGHISRLVLVVPRVFIANPYTPIPLIGNPRQFVVSASRLSIEAEAASREAFWYREELLKNITGTWKEEGTDREGDVDFRKGIRLSARMIDALRVDHVEIEFSVKLLRQHEIEPADNESIDAGILQMGKSHFIVPTETFATLVVRVRNHTRERLRLLLRLQPSLRHQPHNVALDLSKRFVWSGVLQRAIHPQLEPGSVREVELGITALAEGEFEVGATVEEIQGRRAHAASRGGDDVVGVAVGAERRLWHAREPCLIDAVEAPHHRS